jgi:hypothetical protein
LLLLGAGIARAADDGRTTTSGPRTLTVSKANEVNPDGETITVDGKGYDNTKGIYVAFCVVQPADKAPSPCGGGQDRSGSSGESVWVSSNPPLSARGLTTPYGKGGTFHVQIHVQAMLNETTDCRKVLCAISTRNDHTRSSDRSQDVYVPMHFVGGTTLTTAPPAPTTTPSGGKAAPATTTTTIDPSSLAAPLATISSDHRQVNAGGKSLHATQTDGLGSGSQVQVEGFGYDTTKGIYVSLCFINEANAPGPCASGSAGQSAWISSNPPAYGKGLATPYLDRGAFMVTLTLDPVIDTDHDCTRAACAIATRNDDTHADDHSQDLMLPVSFAPGKHATNLHLKAPSKAEDGPNLLVRLAAAALVVAVAGGAAFAVRARRAKL